MISKNQIKFVRQLEQKKHRQREQAFVAEGPKVVGDLLAAGFQPKLLFATEEWAAANAACPAVTVTPDELCRLSFLQHPQQVLAVFPLPAVSHSPMQAGARLVLALDGVQDPGNLGTIIRIADWFAIDEIVCSTDTVDAWNPKVIQASMGSIARVHIVYTHLEEYLSHTTLPVYGTLLDGTSIYSQQLPQEAIIVMGNEGNGISPAIRQRVTHRLLIPQFQPGAESLNVAIATAITCSEFRRFARPLSPLIGG
ncbi:MAG: RNA methyltransferase [Prevotella sp.]|nr:RNA methyltransferase [Prevotella sp.]